MDQKPVNKKHILLTGGTGLIGGKLTKQLLGKRIYGKSFKPFVG